MIGTVGYDLDGIIASEGRSLDFLFAYKPAWGVKLRDSRLNPCIGWPVFEFGVIVTGRPICDLDSTKRWLLSKGIANDIYCTEYETQLSSMKKRDFVDFSTRAKIEVCKRLKLFAFVESDPNVIEIMRCALMSQTMIVGYERAIDIGFLSPRKVVLSRSNNENAGTSSRDTEQAVRAQPDR